MRWENKYILIAYFLGIICAKNCRNQTVYVKIIASRKSRTIFFETECSSISNSNSGSSVMRLGRILQVVRQQRRRLTRSAGT